MAAQPPTLRERRRAETSAMIKRTARMLLAAGGADAISVRAIAREIGVTPAAIYRYYSSIQKLIDELRTDILSELDAWIGFVHKKASGNSSANQVGEMMRAFRQWAIEHPREFWLALSPSAGDGRGSTATGREPRVADHLFGAFLRSHEYSSDEGDLAGPGVSAFLSAWARLLGLVTMEISGQWKWMPVATVDTNAFFEAQLAEIGLMLTSEPGNAEKIAIWKKCSTRVPAHD
jgi:AcrR family transcriptional regulator